MLSPEQNLSSEVLELANQARLVLEMAPLRRLPRGVPDTARKCVLGRGLGVEILIDDQDNAYALLLQYRTASSLARVWGVERPCGMWNGWAVLLPSRLNEFVHEFDSRCYPSMESARRDTGAGIQSNLRHLRFDWIDQHTRVTKLLERARSACENAQHAQNNWRDEPCFDLVEHPSAARETHSDSVDEHATASGLLEEMCSVSGEAKTAQNECSDEHYAVPGLIERSRAACERSDQTRIRAEQQPNDAISLKPAASVPTKPRSRSNPAKSHR